MFLTQIEFGHATISKQYIIRTNFNVTRDKLCIKTFSAIFEKTEMKIRSLDIISLGRLANGTLYIIIIINDRNHLSNRSIRKIIISCDKQFVQQYILNIHNTLMKKGIDR